MRRLIPILLVGAVTAFAVACRDSAVAPARPDGNTALASSARGRDQSTTLLATFEISPNGGRYSVGDFEIVFPAGAVCDPSSTQYGARYWNDDCAPLTRTITVRVVAQSHRDRISVDFQPDLRFRPSAGWVTIRTNAYRDLLTSGGARQLSPTSSYFKSFAILYVPSGTSSRIDEALSTGDRSMVTHVDRKTGLVWRRIKHFTGYLIASGFACLGTEDGSCNAEPGSGGTPEPIGGLSAGDLFSTVIVDAPPPVDPVPTDTIPVDTAAAVPTP